MDETRLPTSEEIQELVGFLPRLYAEEFEPEMELRGALNSPDYDPLVDEFFSLLSQPQWCDYRYNENMRNLRGPDAIENASLPEVKTMLTRVRRGENFCGGWWASKIQDGEVGRLLERLIILNGGA